MIRDSGSEPAHRDTGSRGSVLPLVSVIVPVKDRLGQLRVCVDALLGQDYPPGLMQILVVDNGSASSPRAVLPEDPRLELLTEPTPGSYRARNLGLHEARGEVIAFTDADCIPSATWIRTAVNYLLEHPDVSMLGGHVELRVREARLRSGPEWVDSIEGFHQEEYIARGFAVTANMVSRRATFDRVGPFNETLMSGGDAEWGRRVHDLRGRQSYVAQAVVAHPARTTWPELREKTARTTQGIAAKASLGPKPLRRLMRILASPLIGIPRVILTVWYHPNLPSARSKILYLGAKVRVEVVIAVTVTKAIFQCINVKRIRTPTRRRAH